MLFTDYKNGIWYIFHNNLSKWLDEICIHVKNVYNVNKSILERKSNCMIRNCTSHRYNEVWDNSVVLSLSRFLVNQKCVLSIYLFSFVRQRCVLSLSSFSFVRQECIILIFVFFCETKACIIFTFVWFCLTVEHRPSTNSRQAFYS